MQKTTLETSGANFVVKADRLHISSVIYNLLDNALKYSKGDPQIHIHLLDQTQYIELRIADNGIGIEMNTSAKYLNSSFVYLMATHIILKAMASG
jgi:two-component system phosphate regulon sensor histidine kinase PhoR